MRPTRSLREYLSNAVEDRLAVTRSVLAQLNALRTELVTWRGLARTNPALLYDALTSVSGGSTSAAPTTLSDLDDVMISSPTEGDLLTLDTGNWVNRHRGHRIAEDYRNELLYRELLRAGVPTGQTIPLQPNAETFTVLQFDGTISQLSAQPVGGTRLNSALGQIYISRNVGLNPGNRIRSVVEDVAIAGRTVTALISDFNRDLSDSVTVDLIHGGGETAEVNTFTDLSSSSFLSTNFMARLYLAQATVPAGFLTRDDLEIRIMNGSTTQLIRFQGALLHFS